MGRAHPRIIPTGVILPKALVLQDKYFGKNYLPFLDFTHNYKRSSGIFVPCPPQSKIKNVGGVSVYILVLILSCMQTFPCLFLFYFFFILYYPKQI